MWIIWVVVALYLLPRIIGGVAGTITGVAEHGRQTTGAPARHPGHVKIGLRTPSLQRSIRARTTGKWTREVKRAIIPGYGRKGMGWLRDPHRAMYNYAYRRTTVGLPQILGVEHHRHP